MGKNFTELAEDDADNAYFNAYHFERPGFGFGVDYKIDQKFISDRINWRAGFYYEMNRTTQQVSLMNTAGSTRDEEVELQAKIFSVTGVYPRQHYDLLFGFNYTMMTSDADDAFNDYEVKDDYGFHAGAGYERGGYRYQIVYRYLTHETEADDGYEGQIDLSSVLLTVGSYF